MHVKKNTALREFDLNLLISLQALLDERHISRAAEKVGLSQPGMSRAFQRLRCQFCDPLLIKGEGGYELTPKAKAIEAPLRRLIASIHDIYAPVDFDPAKATGEFRIAALDYEFIVLLPLLTENLRRIAPGLTIKALPFTNESFEPLIRGDVHLVLTAVEDVPEDLFRQQIFIETNTCMVNSLFLHLNRQISLEKFSELEHVWIYLRNPDPGKIDKTLSDIGMARNIVNTAPTFFLSAYTVASSTKLITVLPRRIEAKLKGSMPIYAIDVPIRFEQFKVCQIWHERHHKDETHQFIRNLIADLCKSV